MFQNLTQLREKIHSALKIFSYNGTRGRTYIHAGQTHNPHFLASPQSGKRLVHNYEIRLSLIMLRKTYKVVISCKDVKISSKRPASFEIIPTDKLCAI